MLDRLGTEGGVRALWVVASNVVVSAPRSGHVAERLRSLDFLVVSDFFLSETAAMADVVLPSAQWAEETGTMTNLEGRVILRRAAMTPPAGVRSDLWVMRELAARLGRPALSDDAGEIFEELRRASQGGKADYAGITYERIVAEKGVFWPCPYRGHPGTPRLFTEDFPTRDRRAHLHPVEHRGPAETPDDEYPYFLTTGRLLRQYQSGTQTRRVASLSEAEPDAVVELHSTLAQRIGVVAGDLVLLRSRRGQVVMRAHHRRHPLRHGLRTVPLRRRGCGQPAHQPGPRPALPDAGVPGLRRRHRGLPERQQEGENMNNSSTPWFLQGIYRFEGAGLDAPFLLDPSLTYTVPPGSSTQPVYFRGGNSCAEMVYVTLVRDGVAVGYFPIAAKGATHVSLRVVEDLLSDTVIEVFAAATQGVTGSLVVVVDVGLVEI